MIEHTDEHDRAWNLTPAWSDEEKNLLLHLHRTKGLGACYARFCPARTPKAVRSKIRAERTSSSRPATAFKMTTINREEPESKYDTSLRRVDTSGRMAILADRIRERKALRA